MKKILAVLFAIFMGISLLVLIHGHAQPWGSPKGPFSVSMSPLIEGVDFGRWGWNLSRNYMGLPIFVQTPNPNIQMEFSVDGGGFYISTEHADITYGFDGQDFQGNQLTVPSDYAVYWHYLYEEEDGSLEAATSDPPYYVRIILREENQIVGYAVLQITLHPERPETYNFNTLSYLYFPKIDDKYQTITLEYVQQQMDAVIASVSET